MSILDHPLISQRYFFPRSEPLANPFTVAFPGGNLACHYYQPHEDAPTVVHFHGNGEVVADYLGPYVESFGAIGLNLLMAEYRGYGGSTGEPALAAMLDDVPAIIQALGLPHEKIILFGRSLGSIYAIHGASLFPNIGGLIIESGIGDTRERLLLRVRPEEIGCDLETFDQEVEARLSHERKLRGYKGPLLIMHTRNDGLLDLYHAEDNYQWAQGPKTLKIFEEGTHNNIIAVNATAYFQTIKAFVETL